jgi:hypothetical protein
MEERLMQDRGSSGDTDMIVKAEAFKHNSSYSSGAAHIRIECFSRRTRQSLLEKLLAGMDTAPYC